MGHDVNFAFLARTLEVTTATPGYSADFASIFLGALILELHYEEPVGGCVCVLCMCVLVDG